MKIIKHEICLLSIILFLAYAVTPVRADGENLTVEESGTCGEAAYWTYSDDVLTISGEGEITCRFNEICPQVKEVIIVDGITSIGSGSFMGCSNLISINIPDSVTNIKNVAFALCSSLLSVTIPEGTTTIDTSTFNGCGSLSNVTLPKSVTKIGDYAFQNCSSLKSITIPDSVTNIGSFAFCGCSSLEGITIPENVSNIGDEAFSGCSSFTNIRIPDSITRINNSVFRDCSSLTSIIVPDGVTEIGYAAFYGCTSLTSISIPDSVKTVGNSAFSNCYNIEKVFINDLKAWAAIDFYYKKDNIKFYDQSNPLSQGAALYLNGEIVEDVIIPDGAESIGKMAFYRYYNLKSLVIPDSVTAIGDYAFGGCTNLTSISIPNSVVNVGVHTLGESAFENKTVKCTVHYSGTSEEWVKTFKDDFLQVGNSYKNELFFRGKPVVNINGFKLNKSYLKITAGSTAALKPIFTPADTDYKELTWKSSDGAIASVDADGNVTGKKVGKVTITATVKRKTSLSAKCTVDILFTDVTNTNNAAYIPIYSLVEKGIVQGFGGVAFKPYDTVTRAQVVLFLWRAAGMPAPRSSMLNFKDVSEIMALSLSYRRAIAWGNENGIVMGYTSPGPNQGKFKPNDPCTRGQIVTFLWRYSGQKAAKSGAKTFPDVPKDHKYYKAIMWASSYGITTGFSDGLFRPDQTCTRGQCVTFLYRMIS